MDTRKMWAARVADWRASGQTSTHYCEGKPFSAGGLRYWSSRLQREGSPEATPPKIRIAKVVVERKASVPVPGPEQESSGLKAETAEAALFIECGGLRVAVRPGFDRGSLAAVLDVLATRSAR